MEEKREAREYRLREIRIGYCRAEGRWIYADEIIGIIPPECGLKEMKAKTLNRNQE
ncbi:MAG: hypothetical protein HYW27_00940 [Candidatus Aenigmarchaeota archaeon]|nr:hypothetical protein [Candidatus Aenigmarchaeota archaeon]